MSPVEVGGSFSQTCLRVPEAPYRAENLIQGGQFVHYLVGGALDVRGVEVSAQDQHPHIGIGPSQIGDQISPIPVGQPQIQDRHVEFTPRCVGTGFDERSGLRYQVDVRLAAKQNLHEISEVGMILDVHDTNSLGLSLPAHCKTRRDKGTRSRTLVPRSCSLLISSSPPMSTALSRMLPIPTPGGVSGPNPCPSSEISTRRSPPSISRPTAIRSAPECLRALVRASWIMREACVPVSPNGAEGTCSPTSRLSSTFLAIVLFRLTRDSTISGKGRSSSASTRRSLTTSRRP